MIVRGLIWYLESASGTGTLQTIITFLIFLDKGGGAFLLHLWTELG